MAETDDLRDLEVFARVFARGERIDSDAGRSQFQEIQERIGTRFNEDDMARLVTTLPPREDGVPHSGAEIQQAMQAQDAEVVRITGKLIAETPLTTEELRSMQQATGTALSEAQMREAAQNVTTSGDISVAGDIRTAVQTAQQVQNDRLESLVANAARDADGNIVMPMTGSPQHSALVALGNSTGVAGARLSPEQVLTALQGATAIDGFTSPDTGNPLSAGEIRTAVQAAATIQATAHQLGEQLGVTANLQDGQVRLTAANPEAATALLGRINEVRERRGEAHLRAATGSVITLSPEQAGELASMLQALPIRELVRGRTPDATPETAPPAPDTVVRPPTVERTSGPAATAGSANDEYMARALDGQRVLTAIANRNVTPETVRLAEGVLAYQTAHPDLFPAALIRNNQNLVRALGGNAEHPQPAAPAINAGGPAMAGGGRGADAATVDRIVAGLNTMCERAAEVSSALGTQMRVQAVQVLAALGAAPSSSPHGTGAGPSVGGGGRGG